MAVVGAGLLALTLAAAGSVNVEAEDAGSTSLNAVLVTAGGRPEPAGQTPISLKIHDRAKIERQGLQRIDDIALQTPGLSFVRTAYGATTQIAIRGLVAKLGASTTGLYLDDAPIQLRSLGFTAANPYPALFDLERVEVLQGPQGTLYGAGAEGGAIRFITPDADLSRSSGQLKLEGGHVDGGGWSYEAGAAAGAPLVQDKAAFRLAVWTRHDGGYIDRVDRETGRLIEPNANRQDSRMARLALAFALSPRLTVSPKLEFQERRRKENDAYWEGFSDPGSGRFASAFRTPQPDRDRWVLPSVKLAFQADGALLTVTSSYFQRTDRGVVDYSTLIPSTFGPPVVKALPGYLAYAEMANKQTAVSHEFRLQSTTPGARVDWLVGAYYGSARQRAIEVLNDPQGDALAYAALGISLARATGAALIDRRYSFLLDNTARDRQAAVFGDVRLHVGRAWTVVGGLRAASTRFEFRGAQSGPYAGVSGGAAAGTQAERPVTPKLGLNFQADAETLVYLGAAKGYRIGGVNPPAPPARCAADLAALGLSATPGSYRSDHVWSYEAGIKTSLFDRRLSLQSSAYWIDWSRIQQSVGLPGCGFQFTENLGSATSRGFDLALQARPIPNLLVSLSLAYVDARFDGAVRGGVVAATGQRALIVAAGDRLGVRPWTAAVSAEYRFQGPAGVPAYLRADYAYLGPQATPTPVTDPLAVGYDPGLPGAKAAQGLNARLGGRFDQVEIALFADNLFDSAPRLLRAHDAKTSPLYAGVTMTPRTLGITARYAF